MTTTTTNHCNIGNGSNVLKIDNIFIHFTGGIFILPNFLYCDNKLGFPHTSEGTQGTWFYHVTISSTPHLILKCSTSCKNHYFLIVKKILPWLPTMPELLRLVFLAGWKVSPSNYNQIYRKFPPWRPWTAAIHWHKRHIRIWQILGWTIEQVKNSPKAEKQPKNVGWAGTTANELKQTFTESLLTEVMLRIPISLKYHNIF